jgi:hypothetical protein
MIFCGLAIMPATMVHNDRIYGAWFATGIFSMVGMLALYFPVCAWFVGNKAIKMLQHGSTTSAKFFGVNLKGTWRTSPPVVEFTYQVEGKAYQTSTQMIGVSHFTIDTYKDVFYDPAQPEQSVVLLENILFDKQTGRFECSPLCYIPCLVVAGIICCEIIAITVLVVQAI